MRCKDSTFPSDTGEDHASGHASDACGPPILATPLRETPVRATVGVWDQKSSLLGQASLIISAKDLRSVAEFGDTPLYPSRHLDLGVERFSAINSWVYLTHAEPFPSKSQIQFSRKPRNLLLSPPTFFKPMSSSILIQSPTHLPLSASQAMLHHLPLTGPHISRKRKLSPERT
jgi:hypothetical protein